MPKLVAPEATLFNLPEFLHSEAFFPPNATRTFDSGEPPVAAGRTKLYTQFPAVEPYSSPAGRWQWRFNPKGETTLNKLLRLETIAGEQQMEVLLHAPTISLLWADDNNLSALTSWEDAQSLRIDVINLARRTAQRIFPHRAALGKFFAYDELDGLWSLQARAWKSGGVLIVRGIKPGASPLDKLCVAEFSVDVMTNRQDEAVRLLRAFVVEPK